ncbi:hypothetical protein BJY04DRAFT_219786 [Aspergillus karnatakaensis]|uniref:uncharacterized protein n=1 Tax=Aspergillus karnatakaensis TaxID=1810916 RepID=UPI003CCD55BC
MFISHDPRSGKARSDARKTINAFVAATASAKRRSQRNNTADEVTVSFDWLHEQPIALSRGRTVEEEDGRDCAAVGGDMQINPGAGTRAVAMARSMKPRAEMKRLVRAMKLSLAGCASVEPPIGRGYNYPVPQQKYYPSLLFQRQSLFLAVADQYRDTFAFEIHNSWTQTVLSDPCLFHATMFATSSFGDLVRQTRNNPVTIRHKYETVRLLQKAILNRGEGGSFTNALAATTYLLYFSKLAGDDREGDMHNAGIDSMLNFKGTKSLETDNYASYLVRIRNIWMSVLNRHDTLYPTPTCGPRPLMGHYTSLLAIAIQRQLERAPHATLPFSVLEFLITFDAYLATPYGPPKLAFLSQSATSDPESPPNADHDDTQAALRSCHIAASIYFRAIVMRGRWYHLTESQNVADTQSLKDALLQVDTMFWLKYSPEVLRWILMIGCIAAPRLADQAWFIARCYLPAAIIRPKDMDAFLLGVDHMLWLFNHRGFEDLV